MNKRGFTIVELIVVITIMGILLGLVTVSFRNYQVNARDEQRKNRAENIARYIETIYSTGSTNPTVDRGEYPALDTIAVSSSNSYPDEAKLKLLFSKNGFDLSNILTAGKETIGIRIVTDSYYSTPTSASLSHEHYLYQPLYYYDSNVQPLRSCYDSANECRSFNLYYKTEADNVVHKISGIH